MFITGLFEIREMKPAYALPPGSVTPCNYHAESGDIIALEIWVQYKTTGCIFSIDIISSLSGAPHVLQRLPKLETIFKRISGFGKQDQVYSNPIPKKEVRDYSFLMKCTTMVELSSRPRPMNSISVGDMIWAISIPVPFSAM